MRQASVWEPLRRIETNVRRRLEPGDLVCGLGHWFANDATDTLGLGQGLEWDPFETEILSHLIASGATAIDVGAHIGYFTLQMAHGVGRRGRVIAFEPDPANRSLLKRNVRLNGYHNVTVEPSAISAHPGTATLYQSLENRGDNRIVDPGEDRPAVSVPCTSLDDYVAAHGLTVDLIKMDIQGAEAEALNGIERLLASSPHLVLTCEFWPYGLVRAGADPSGFLERLRAQGLHVVHMDADARCLEPASGDDLLRRFPVDDPDRHTNLLCSMDGERLERLEKALRAARSSPTRSPADTDTSPGGTLRGRLKSGIPRSPLRKLWYVLLRGTRNAFVAFVGHFPRAVDRMEHLIRRLFPVDAHPFPSGVLLSLIKRVQPLFLDYPVFSRPRWGFGEPVHQQISWFLEERTSVIREVLESFLPYARELARIPRGPEDAQPGDPTWVNDYFGGMDAVALYGFIATQRPNTYIEIGSGMSTKFARRSIWDNDLATRIISIDPAPRAEVDALCDEQIRQPLEDVDLSIFEDLGAGDIVFMDGSHRVFMNSDVVVFFLEVLPRLPAGVNVHLHDVLLPCDYYPEWAGRYYSEQYMLASFLLGGAKGVDVVLPCTFVWCHPKLVSVLAPIWAHPDMEGVPPHGSSFWMQTTGELGVLPLHDPGGVNADGEPYTRSPRGE